MITAPPPASERKGAPSKPPAGAPAAPLDHGALLDALHELMQPVAALAVARGVSYAAVEEIVKRAFVTSARAAQSDAAGQRLVSRISTATGLNRREVTRLSTADARRDAPRRSVATEVFTRWVAESGRHGQRAKRRSLPRQGPAPSFEALARSVTNDVHPRSLLDELCRLGLARVEGETVHLVHRSFVPRDDRQRMLGFLGSNVGDHLRAAVANVLSSAPPHLEQAVFADELSTASMEQVDALVRKQWQTLMTAAVPELHRLLEADQAAQRTRDQHVRIGLYMYSATMPVPPGEKPSTTSPAARARKPRGA